MKLSYKTKQRIEDLAGVLVFVFWIVAFVGSFTGMNCELTGSDSKVCQKLATIVQIDKQDNDQ